MRLYAIVLSTVLFPASALAGDVSVVVTGDSLRVTGSASGDSLTISQDPGGDPHEFRVAPGMSTTVNGSGALQTFPGVKKDVFIEAGGGLGDEYRIDGARIPRDLRLSTSGIGSAVMTAFDVVVGRDVRADASSGAQGLHFVPTGTTIKGDVRMRGGDAADEVNVEISTAILGDVRFDPRGNADRLRIANSSIRGRVDMEESPGIDMLLVINSDVDGPIRFTDRDEMSTASISLSTVGPITLQFGDGSDDVNINTILGRGAVKLDLGGGANQVGFESLRFDEKVVVRCGDGDDQVEVAGNAVFDHGLDVGLGDGTNMLESDGSQVTGSFVVKAGDGSDTIDISQSSIGDGLRCSVGGAPAKNSITLSGIQLGDDARIIGGSAKDDLIVYGLRAGGDLRAALGDGPNYCTIGSSVLDDIRLAAGVGDDELNCGEGTIARGDVQVNAGGGENEIGFGSAVFREDLGVKAGSGDDSLVLPPLTTVLGKTKVDLGGGTNLQL